MKVINLRLFIAGAFLIALWVGAVRGVNGDEEGSTIPVDFLQNEEISLGLYPSEYQAAAVLAGTGLDGEEYLYPVRPMIIVLANEGVKGTVFLTAGDIFRQNLKENRHWLELLSELSVRGFEIAQNFSQNPRDSLRENGPESGSLDTTLASRIERIKEDKEFLGSLGQEPDGYRDYDTASADRIIPALDKMGYMYFCAIEGDDNSRSDLRNEDEPDPQRVHFFPQDIAGLEILKFYSQVDPAADMIKARRLFDEAHKRSGVIIYNIHLPGLSDQTKRVRLKKFISYLKMKKAWVCSLRELSGWWNARQKIDIKTRWDGDTLVIVYDNLTRFLLKNARLNFRKLKPSARYYRIENREGIVASQGIIPDSRFVNATLFSAEPEG